MTSTVSHQPFKQTFSQPTLTALPRDLLKIILNWSGDATTLFVWRRISRLFNKIWKEISGNYDHKTGSLQSIKESVETIFNRKPELYKFLEGVIVSDLYLNPEHHLLPQTPPYWSPAQKAQRILPGKFLLDFYTPGISFDLIAFSYNLSREFVKFWHSIGI